MHDSGRGSAVESIRQTAPATRPRSLATRNSPAEVASRRAIDRASYAAKLERFHPHPPPTVKASSDQTIILDASGTELRARLTLPLAEAPRSAAGSAVANAVTSHAQEWAANNVPVRPPTDSL